VVAGLTFQWDPRKESTNQSKHGVSFEEAMTVFGDPFARIFDDLDHSFEEAREIIVGQSSQRRLLVVCFNQRSSGIRIVSARRATKREGRDYEERT
jgi:uncharacterized DUF497 family protein